MWCKVLEFRILFNLLPAVLKIMYHQAVPAGFKKIFIYLCRKM